jgi:6-pyruvoyltetrahydropterin/6-carboxytetrahydropterin synthase
MDWRQDTVIHAMALRSPGVERPARRCPRRILNGYGMKRNKNARRYEFNYPMLLENVLMGEKFEIHVKTDFSAAHRLDGYPGDCARTHGHNWIVEVHVQCLRLNEIGIGIDFRDIKKALGEVLLGLDHLDLNALEAFRDVNPSSENVARHIYRELAGKLDDGNVKVVRAGVWETEGAGASYWED